MGDRRRLDAALDPDFVLEGADCLLGARLERGTTTPEAPARAVRPERCTYVAAVGRHVVVNDRGDTVDVDTTRRDVGGHEGRHDAGGEVAQ